MNQHNESKLRSRPNLKPIMVTLVVAGLFACNPAGLGASPSPAFERIESGIYRIDGKTADGLLTLRDQPDLDVLVLESNKKQKNISDAHMKLLRQWVEAGGVLWVAGEGLENPLAQAVAPFRFESFDFVRSSSGKRGGELIVKGLSPRMSIADHEFTADVSQLYLFARSKFDGTAQAEPLVKMGDTSGNSGWVVVAIPVGRGFMILDGTARDKHWLFRRLKGFDEDHPNCLEQDSNWNCYDWEQMRVNARDHSNQALAGTEWSQPSDH
ncbi:MAG TPA: hypothetical protein VFV75_12360 [Candidatus Polarisedimenticolaceae bacterium]|nr:hypothetical protein [Candidatus Polarisedimenticolaceae bacterium]